MTDMRASMEEHQKQYTSMKSDLSGLGDIVAELDPSLIEDGGSVAYAVERLIKGLKRKNTHLEQQKVTLKASISGMGKKLWDAKQTRQELDKRLTRQCKKRKEQEAEQKKYYEDALARLDAEYKSRMEQLAGHERFVDDIIKSCSIPMTGPDHLSDILVYFRQLEAFADNNKHYREDYAKLNKAMMYYTGDKVWGAKLIPAAIDYMKEKQQQLVEMQDLNKAVSKAPWCTLGKSRQGEAAKYIKHLQLRIIELANENKEADEFRSNVLEIMAHKDMLAPITDDYMVRCIRKLKDNFDSLEKLSMTSMDAEHNEICREAADRKTAMCRELLQQLEKWFTHLQFATFSKTFYFPSQIQVDWLNQIRAAIKNTEGLHPIDKNTQAANEHKIKLLKDWLKASRALNKRFQEYFDKQQGPIRSLCDEAYNVLKHSESLVNP